MVDHSQHIEYKTIDNFVKTPYPWYTKEYSHIDPSVIDNTQPHTLTTPLLEIKDVANMTDEKWLEDDTPINNPRLILGILIISHTSLHHTMVMKLKTEKPSKIFFYLLMLHS